MKKLFFTISALCFSLLVIGQPTQTENYIKTTTYKTPVQNQSEIDALSVDDKIEQVNYVDGLGRTKQSLAVRAGGNQEDIISPIVYDDFGRQTIDYLPYSRSVSSLGYEEQDVTFFNTLNTQYQTKYPNDINANNPNPYSKKRLEASPQGRVLEQGAPGEDWAINSNANNNHTVRFDYKMNATGEVLQFDVQFNNGNTEDTNLFYEGYYDENTLYKSIIKDENWSLSKGKNHTSEEFKDKQGRVILKRTYNGSTNPHDTYYTYDRFGNLTYVMSPKGTDNLLVSNNYKNFLNSYKHDAIVELDKKGNPKVTGSGTLDVSISGLILTLDFNLNFGLTGLQEGTTIHVANGQSIPNMFIGTISGSGYSYDLTVQDGFLSISGSGQLTSITQTFTVNIPTHSVDSEAIDDLGYIYHYDYRNRLIEKKIPGKGWEYIIYNKLDTPVMTQDSNLRAQNKWLFTKYDALGRIVYTGVRVQNVSRKNMQTFYNNTSNPVYETKLNSPTSIGGTQVYYTSDAYPSNLNSEILTINYYDNYTFDTDNISAPANVYGVVPTTETKSLATGSKIRVLGTDHWITTVTFYDEKARPIYSKSKNQKLFSEDISLTKYDFMGNALVNRTQHKRGALADIFKTERFTYDHVNRLTKHTQQIDGESEALISKNIYDELGQLEQKDVGNTAVAPLQNIDYTYNIRGWLKTINNLENLGNDLFSFEINYNKPVIPSNSNGGTTTKLYNGNITETIWKTVSLDYQSAPSEKKGYRYGYDALNRIRTAYMARGNTFDHSNFTSAYALFIPNYDKNGNILKLYRNGKHTTSGDYTSVRYDELIYDYDGNQLTEVNDLSNANGYNEGTNSGSGIDYTYDANGNMISDAAKDITDIDYNHLNLPTQITFGNTSTINYIYDATGIKLKKEVNDVDNSSLITTYAGNYIYENDILKFFSHPEGYVEPDGNGSFNYIYQYKDHLGNIRLSYSDFDDNGSVNTSEIIEENNYYPFGLKHKGYNDFTSANVNSAASKFKYNGIELEEAFDLNLYEMPFRQYDPALGRFMSIDPVTHFSNSTYNAFDNNPIYWADPSGADGECYTCIDSGSNGMLKGADGSDYTSVASGFEDFNRKNNERTKKKKTVEILSVGPLEDLNDPEDDIKQYEENERIIIENSIIIQSLLYLTEVGQLKTTLEASFSEWEVLLDNFNSGNRRFSDNKIQISNRDVILGRMEGLLAGLGIKATTKAPHLKTAAGIIIGSLNLENAFRGETNRLYYAPRIKKNSPYYYRNNIKKEFHNVNSGGGAYSDY